MKRKNLSNLIKIAVLSGMAFVIMAFLEFPLPIFPDFLKIDLSDIPALLGAFAMGPVAGIIIELVKNILHILLKGTTTAGIGELANFVVGSALVFTAGSLYKHNKNRKNAVISLIAGVGVMSLVAVVSNYYVFLPLYEKALHFPIAGMVAAGAKIFKGIKDFNTFIAYSIIPFNLVKGIITALITIIIYKKLSPILHK
jgi:riboflavin transporter FmnP